MAKSIFIVLYMTVAIIVTINSVRGLVDGDMVLGSLALFLTSAPVAFMLVRLMLLRDKARTDPNLKVAALLGALGASIALIGWYVEMLPYPVLVTALGMAILFGLYVGWYSKLDRSGSMLVVGLGLPKFELENADGTAVASESFEGSPTVLIFYRGNWCPLCVAQVKEMAANYNQLRTMGARVIFVSPQPQGNTVALAEKFGTDGLEFMRDAESAAAKTLGIDARFGTPMGMQALGYDSHTVLPTVIITDASGTVIWTHETDNYRVRPEPQTYLKVLNDAGIKAA